MTLRRAESDILSEVARRKGDGFWSDFPWNGSPDRKRLRKSSEKGMDFIVQRRDRTRAGFQSDTTWSIF